jgi:predicted MFS family arabinose efflux permease
VQKTTRPSVRWLTATACAALFLYATTPPLLSVSLKAISTDLGIGYGARGNIALARAAVIAVITLAVGWLADRLGKRYLLTLSMLLVTAGMLCVGRSGELPGLVGGIAVMSMGLGGLEALSGALVCDLYPRAVASRVGFVYAFYPCGTVVSSLAIGVVLDAGVGWRAPFSVIAIPCAVVAAMYWVGSYPEASAGARAGRLTVGRILASGTFWLLLSAMFLAAGAFGCVVYWGPTFIQEAYGASAKAGAAGLAVFMAGMAVGRFGTGAVTRFVPLSRIMLAMAIAGTVSTLMLVLANGLWATMATLALSGVALCCFWPGILALAATRISAGSTTLLAMISSAGIVGFGLLPAGLGQLATRWGLRTALGICPATMLLTGVLLLMVPAREPVQTPPAENE